MKYTFTFAFTFLVLLASKAQEVIYESIDNGSGVALGVAISPADDGINTFTGDGVELAAGDARILTEVTIACFVLTDTTFISDDFTVSFYSDCPSDGVGATGACGDNAGTLIGTETIELIAAPTTANPIVIPLPNIDISSETDGNIWIMFNSVRPNIAAALNGVPITGMESTQDPTAVNSFVKCGTNDSSNCTQRIAGAASNSFVIRLSATEALDINETNLEQAISIFPNPIQNEVTIAFQDEINPTQAKIFDINGKQVSQKFTYNLENNFKMDMSELSSGTYFLHFESEEGTVVKQLIKR